MPENEREYENVLRPLSLRDFSGQAKVVENLKVFVMAARMRKEALDHVLLHGPPGLGKTTLSNIIANELGVGFKVTSGPVLDKPGDLAGVLTSLEKNDAREIASRSRGTPRIANALLRRVRDFAQVKGNGDIDKAIACFSLEALNIDRYGLDQIDNKLLTTIIDKFQGGPVGLTTIATALGEDPGTLEEVYEPFLIKEGFIKRTPRGREVTDLAYTHLGRSRVGEQGFLFD